MNLSLFDAFGRFGARPTNRVRALSAIAADGAVVLNCANSCFGHPSRGVLRYEDTLSRENGESKDAQLLRQHLELARDGTLPVRMIVMSLTVAGGGKSVRAFHVRPDLVGKLVEFDGDHFIIDFTRTEVLQKVRGRQG